jgi:hypothetical protein
VFKFLSCAVEVSGQMKFDKFSLGKGYKKKNKNNKNKQNYK